MSIFAPDTLAEKIDMMRGRMAYTFSIVRPYVPMPSVKETLEKSAQLDALLRTPLSVSRGPPMPTITSLADRIRAVRAKREQRFAAIERDHVTRVDAAERRQDEALDKLEQKLKSDAELDEAEVRALEDEINQLTNGAP